MMVFLHHNYKRLKLKILVCQFNLYKLNFGDFNKNRMYFSLESALGICIVCLSHMRQTPGALDTF